DLRVWDARTLTAVRIVGCPEGTHVKSCSVSPDGRLIATASWPSRRVELWDLERGSERVGMLEAGDQPALAVAFLPGSDRLVAAGADGVVRVFDVGGRSLVRELRGHTAAVTALAVSP